MRAFVESLCQHTGIVRAGPYAESYGDPYDYAVVYRIEYNTAHVKALTSDGKFTLAHHRAIVAALEERGLTVQWQRFKKVTLMKMEISIRVWNDDGSEHHSVVYTGNPGYVQMQAAQSAVVSSLVGLGDAKAAEIVKTS